MLVSAVQQSELALCIHISLPSWICSLAPTPPHPSRSSQSTELSSLCGSAGSHWLICFTHGSVYMSNLIFQFTVPVTPLPSHVHISVLYIHVSFPAQQIGSEASTVFDGDFIIPANFCMCLILLGLRKLERYSCNKYVIITNSGNKYPCNQIFFLVVFGKSLIEKCSKICGHNS